MKVEHKELKEKLDALNKFIHSSQIFKELDDLEQTRMIKQAGVMESYLSILESRIWCAQSA